MAKETKEDEPTLESLEPIRESIRRLCAQDQFTWEESWKSVLSHVNQARRGLLLPDVFQQTLELNDIRLTKKALQSVVEQFQLSNGAVQAHKFLHWINLSKPSDHVDPELAFARLPQPFRRIVKVLERDILDAAWEQIQRTSAKYKAETSAALSARSARSSVLLTHAPEEAAALQDDYAAAKKRCCKASGDVPVPTSGTSGSVVLLHVHRALPFCALGWAETGDDPCLTLQLVHTTSRRSLASIRVELPVASVAAVASTAENPTHTRLQLMTASALVSRPRADVEPSSDVERLVLAIHVRRVVATADATVSTEDHTLLYEFRISSSQTTAHLLSALAFSNVNETVTTLALSSDASLLAVATNTCETSVYSVPAPAPAEAADVETAVSSPLPALSLVTKLSTGAPATAVYFLAPPIVDTPTRPSSGTLPPYGIALVAGKSLVKYQLPLSTDNASTPVAVATWPHLTSITSSSVDSTSQFVTVGLADGLVIVWDLLADRDYVMLTSPSPPSQPASAGDTVDVALFCGNQFVVSLLLASQRLVFHDIANRAAPALIRVVTPPAPSNNAASAAVEQVRFVSLSLQTSWLDVPVAMVAYSNGYAMLYDVRNGEAMGSVRIAKTALDGSTHVVAPANSAVLVLTPAPAVFDWVDLLTTAFPSLLTVLKAKCLEPSVDNVKRVFIASVDVSSGGLFGDRVSLSIGPKPSLHSMLLASAGSSHSTTARTTAGELLSGSKSSSSLSQAVSNTDSRTSLATTVSGTAIATPQEHETPPGLLECASYPYKPTISALFDCFCHEEIHTSSSPGEAKLHRRRNELLKILTAAW